MGLDDALIQADSARAWKFFVLLQVLLTYWAVRYTGDPLYATIIDGALTPIHEMGHFVCQGMGMFLAVLGGSLFQWGLPLGITVSFLRRRDYYAACVGLFLLGVAFSASYAYMDSSFQMEKYPDLRFVSLGDGEAIHDWQYLFGVFKLYRGYTAVALLMRSLGLLMIWAGTLGGAILLWRTARAVKNA